MARSPGWLDDELILTLNLYLQFSPSVPARTSEELVNLSNLLRQLHVRLYGGVDAQTRSVHSVHMKMDNFRSLDQAYGGMALSRRSSADEKVWNRYAYRREHLRTVADRIRKEIESSASLDLGDLGQDEEQTAEEGQLLTRVHRVRERDTKLAQRKKKAVLRKQGVLACEVCNLDFSAVYGERGKGYIECHHTRPLSELPPTGGTLNLTDLALVCSNCHRMIHCRSPWMTIGELRDVVQAQAAST